MHLYNHKDHIALVSARHYLVLEGIIRVLSLVCSMWKMFEGICSPLVTNSFSTSLTCNQDYQQWTLINLFDPYTICLLI